MKRPVAYLRKSKVDPGTRDASWEVQEAKVRALAARHGDDELEILSDWGRSGRGEKTRLRPEYRRLRTMIAAGEVSVLYSYSLSRLSRSLTDYAALAELCREHGVRVRLDKEGEIDYGSASGRAMVGILAVLAQMEAELSQERARDTIQARRARGDHIGSAAYGKRMDRGTLVDNPREDLTDVTNAYRDAGSFAGAARVLNEAKVRSKFGKAWSGTTVKRVLMTSVPGEVNPRRIEPRVKQRGAFTLSRLLRCPCGQLLTGRTGRGSRKYKVYEPYASYQCYRGRYEPDHPRPYMVSERAVLPWVIEQAERFRPPGDQYRQDVDTGRRDELEAQLRGVGDALVIRAYTKEEAAAKVDAIVREIEALELAHESQAIPPIDWTWAPEDINAILREMFVHIELGDDLRPLRAERRVPPEYWT